MVGRMILDDNGCGKSCGSGLGGDKCVGFGECGSSGYGHKNFYGNYSGDGHGGSSGKVSPQKRFRGIGEGGGFSSGRGYEGFTGWGQGSDIKQ